MALPFIVGASILGGSIWATTTPAEVEEDDTQFLENRKKGVLGSVVRAQQSVSGAPNAFGPFNAPDQTVQTLTQMQKAYSRDTTQMMEEQAAFNLRGTGSISRVIVASAGNTIPLMRLLGFQDGGKLGDIRNSETLRDNPLLYGQSENGAIGDKLIAKGRVSGINIADDHSKKFIPRQGKNQKRINSGPTFNEKRNPYAKGGAITQLQQDIKSSRQIPIKGDLTATMGESKFVSKPILINK